VTALVDELMHIPNKALAPRPERVGELVLVAMPSAITCARLLLDWLARRWDMEAATTYASREVLDELVAHTVATTGVAEAVSVSQVEPERLVFLRIRLRFDGRRLVIEVWDTGTETHEALLASSSALAAVDRWGVELPAHHQRVVWCVVESDISAEQTMRLPVPLPRRTRAPVPKPDEPVEAILDPALLQRILDGLRALDTPSQEK
jgi:hypothetical protein